MKEITVSSLLSSNSYADVTFSHMRLWHACWSACVCIAFTLPFLSANHCPNTLHEGKSAREIDDEG